MAVDGVWLERALRAFESNHANAGDAQRAMIRAVREDYDTLRRRLGLGRVTDDERVSLLAAARVVVALAESRFVVDGMPDRVSGLELANSVLASLATTGRSS